MSFRERAQRCDDERLRLAVLHTTCGQSCLAATAPCPRSRMLLTFYVLPCVVCVWVGGVSWFVRTIRSGRLVAATTVTCASSCTPLSSVSSWETTLSVTPEVPSPPLPLCTAKESISS